MCHVCTRRVSCCTRLICGRVSCCTPSTHVDTASIGIMVVVCHVVHDEYTGTCAMFYTTNIVVVVCHVVLD